MVLTDKLVELIS